MHARISTYEGDPGKVDEAIGMIEGQVMPAAKAIPGFSAGYWMVDRDTGKAISVTLWETEEALRASEEAADKLRQEGAAASDASIVSVDRYEVAVQA